MNELFGLSMTYIAAGCVVVTALILAFVGFIAWRNPVMFKNGLRNIPRRKAQTTLIIVGLMLSTVIITAAFGTGDTMTHSVTNEVYTITGPIDEIIEWDTSKHPAPEDQQTIPLSLVEKLRAEFENNSSIKGFIPYIRENVSVLDSRTRLNQAFTRLVATKPEDLAPFGGLKDAAGNPIELQPNQIAVNKALADKIDARIGDKIMVFYKGQTLELTVSAIAPNTTFGGTADPFSREGAAVNYEWLSTLVGRTDSADFVAISNDGSTRGGVGESDKVKALVAPALEGTPYKVTTLKKDLVNMAELLGNVFTTLFIVIGLFSIAAGVLLIFLIFVMLAAERKPEMGMARAVGAKRQQIVESFLAEGMGYDLGAAFIGLFAGVGVAAAMVSFVKYAAGDQLGLELGFNVTVRSLIVAFCLGVIATFIVVFLASVRASRINIVAAIRDLPESRPANPEGSTLRGYLRGTLNGFAAFGFIAIGVLGAMHFSKYFAGAVPLFGIAILAGIPGPWLAMLGGHNFGLRKSEQKDARAHYSPLPFPVWVVLWALLPAGFTVWLYRRIGGRFPAWPLILGLVLLPAFGLGLVIWISYGIALLLVRFTRNRKPESMPTWLIVLGIIVAPIGVVLTALQSRRNGIAWSVGVGMVGLVAGALMIQWGMDAESMSLFALGGSFIALWAAVTLRYFRLHERLSFTIISAALLAFWYMLPGGRLEFLVGKLKGGEEMFFLSGATMVTAGTFIVVYNADVLLPFIAAVGSRFGRIVPAVKTAVAYPLTSRFRTGLTIAMIGLIMFVLSMQSALNTNFAKAFSGEEALGGFNVEVRQNSNNLSTGLLDELQKANAQLPANEQVDTSKITTVGEMRVADVTTVDIRDPKKAVPSDPAKEWNHYTLMGADDAFVDAQKLPLEFRAAGYADDHAVWQALKSNESFAIIPAALTQGQQDFGPVAENQLELPSDYTKDGFEPFKLLVREPATGKAQEITVIGQTKGSAATFWPGIIMSKQNLLQLYPESKGQIYFVGLRPGTDAKVYAKQIEATLITASVDSLEKIIDDNLAINRGFLNMFQGFLALGLLVGIAALGVISFRAVVERRQQIGMLRAIGYKRSMVQLSFLLEAGFIAVSGIVLGLGLGLTFAWNLFTSGEIGGDTTKGVAFTVPWLQVIAVTAFALIASMVMTYLPARQASKVAVAEALRYE